MRIAVIGAGGVGGYFGARLAAAGNEVAFVARGAHLAAMRRDGLRIESAVTPLSLSRVVASDDPSALGPADIVLFCVKMGDLARAAEDARPLFAGGGVAIPFQNGVEAPDILGEILGSERVLGGLAYIAATIGRPGVVVHTGTMARLRFGAFDSHAAPAAAAFLAVCRDAGIDAALSPDIRRALWEKFVFLSAFAGATCLARQPIGVVRADPDLRTVLEVAMREGLAVARAEGVVLADDFVAQQMGFADQLPAEMKASMLHDLEAGRPLEAPWLTGAVIRMAAASDIHVPVNATLHAAMKPYVDGNTSRGS